MISCTEKVKKCYGSLLKVNPHVNCIMMFIAKTT